MRSILFLLVTLVASNAHASGGLHCTGDDPGAKFEIESGVTRGMGMSN